MIGAAVHRPSISLRVMWAFDVEDSVRQMRGFAATVQDAIERGFDVAGRMMVERFREQQLSGRVGDRGLNVVTGNLRESLRNITLVNSRQIIGEVYNRGARYWYYHQVGVNGKKRLYLEEDFEEVAPDTYLSEVERSVSDALNTLKGRV